VPRSRVAQRQAGEHSPEHSEEEFPLGTSRRMRGRKGGVREGVIQIVWHASFPHERKPLWTRAPITGWPALASSCGASLTSCSNSEWPCVCLRYSPAR